MSSVPCNNNYHDRIEDHALGLQAQWNSEIDHKIARISLEKFEELEQNYRSEKRRFNLYTAIKYMLIGTAISLAVLSIACAVAALVISSGVLTGGMAYLPIITGFSGITSTFALFEAGISKFLSLHNEHKKNSTVITRLEKQFKSAKLLLAQRIENLKIIENHEQLQRLAGEIFSQIEVLNDCIRQAKISSTNLSAKYTFFDLTNFTKVVTEKNIEPINNTNAPNITPC